PVEVLKGKLKTGSSGGTLRSVLVVFQFTTSIILIAGTLIVYRQLNYMHPRDLGFDKQQVLIVDGADALNTRIDAFKRDVLNIPSVKSGTITAFLPVGNAQRNENNVFKAPDANSTNAFN